MLYGVFGNLISILEEFEKRETGRGISLPRSRIHIPDQSHNNNDDVSKLFIPDTYRKSKIFKGMKCFLR